MKVESQTCTFHTVTVVCFLRTVHINVGALSGGHSADRGIVLGAQPWGWNCRQS